MMRRLPRAVWALGLVSLMMDISSEMVHGLLPFFLVAGLGAGAAVLGVIEGTAEALAAFVKVASGAWSDRLARRKPLVVAGYTLGALAKPLFAIAAAADGVALARLIDRFGKGIRGAPRDALIADLTSPGSRGAAYGARQALDTIGAFLGPLLAVGLMLALAGNIRLIFWIAALPGLLAVALLVRAVKEPIRQPHGRIGALRLAGVSALGRRFWLVLALAGLIALARFSDAFLILAAMEGGLEGAYTPLVLVTMNLAFAVVTYPAGALSDRVGRRHILAVSLAVLISADLCLATASGLVGVALGVALWGVHMGLSQGLLSALVADAVTPDRRGLAFGLFHSATGLAVLIGNFGAGLLWQYSSAGSAWLAGAVVAAAAIAGIFIAGARVGGGSPS